MAKSTNKTIQETPVVFESEKNQLVGILHQAGNSKVILMCHGFTGNKMESKRLFVEAAREFAKQGFDAFRFDFYGSGDSEGDFSDTLLSHNITNLKDAIKWAREKGYTNIAVLGISMGAATAILTLQEEDADVLVTWSAVPDLKSLFESYVSDLQEKISEIKVYEHDGWLIKREFWEDSTTYNIKEALSRLTMPKLIAQGSMDAPLFVQGFKDFQDIVIPPTDFMEIPGANHTFQNPAHRRQVIRQTAIWLKRHF